MTDAEIVRRIFFSLFSAFCIVNIAGRIIGEKRKSMWFQKRTKSYFFNRRGLLGECLHFGRPKTKEGIMVMAGILAAVALASFIIFSV